MIKFKIKNKCRLCLSKYLDLVVKLPTSVPGEHLKKDKKHKNVNQIPIDLYLCKTCGHVQLIHVPAPKDLWGQEYTFKPSDNPKLKIHFKKSINFFLKNFNSDVKFAFEIGSNDGLFLSEIKKITKCDVLGIDPSDEPVSIARKNNIPTIKDYFSYKTGKKILKKFNKPDLIIANNVFAHIDDMNSMVKGISNMLNYGGYFMFEISYLLDIVKKYLVGTINHEHLSYHSLFSLVPFLKKYNLNLIGFRYVSNVQGGAIVGVAKKSKKSILPYRINKMIKKEIKFGITDVKGMKRFNMKFKKKINSFKNEIFSFIGKKKIIGYGAARSAVLIIDLLKLKKKISFIIDDNPRKKNKFMPIANIPIVSFKKAYKNMSNSVLIILGWAQTERIIKFLKSLGLRLNIITIYPKFKIIKLK